MTKPTEIELHVGHYGDGTGARGIIDEVQYARKFIKRIYDILIAGGVPATYYEDAISKNQTQNINNLIKHHNADRNGFIVSGHLNASGGRTNDSIGVEVLYYDQKVVAQNVANAIATISGMKNRGAKQRTDLGVLARTYEPAILIEFGFVNSKKDVELMDKHFEAICQAVAKQLAAAIGKTLKLSTTSTAKDKKEETDMFKLDNTAKADFAKLFKKAYEDGIFTTDHSSKVASYSDEKIYNLYVSYQIRKELADK